MHEIKAMAIEVLGSQECHLNDADAGDFVNKNSYDLMKTAFGRYEFSKLIETIAAMGKTIGLIIQPAIFILKNLAKYRIGAKMLYAYRMHFNEWNCSTPGIFPLFIFCC